MTITPEEKRMTDLRDIIAGHLCVIRIHLARGGLVCDKAKAKLFIEALQRAWDEINDVLELTTLQEAPNIASSAVSPTEIISPDSPKKSKESGENYIMKPRL